MKQRGTHLDIETCELLQPACHTDHLMDTNDERYITELSALRRCNGEKVLINTLYWWLRFGWSFLGLASLAYT